MSKKTMRPKQLRDTRIDLDEIELVAVGGHRGWSDEKVRVTRMLNDLGADGRLRLLLREVGAERLAQITENYEIWRK